MATKDSVTLGPDKKQTRRHAITWKTPSRTTPVPFCCFHQEVCWKVSQWFILDTRNNCQGARRVWASDRPSLMIAIVICPEISDLLPRISWKQNIGRPVLKYVTILTFKTKRFMQQSGWTSPVATTGMPKKLHSIEKTHAIIIGPTNVLQSQWWYNIETMDSPGSEESNNVQEMIRINVERRMGLQPTAYPIAVISTHVRE